jgi:hypothetical protein
LSWTDERLADLYAYFEALGNNCEFGIVQRRVGFDPPGLFRNVGFLGASQIINAISANLGDMFDDDRFRYERRSGWPDYALCCRSFGFTFHSGIPASVEQGTAEWNGHERRNILSFRFLKRKFQEDLLSGEKIFVYRSKVSLSPREITALHSAVSARGPGWLLVVEENPALPAGKLNVIGKRLATASLAKLSNENPPEIDHPGWAAITRTLLCARFGGAGIPTNWRSPLSATHLSASPKPPRSGLDVLEHRFHSDTAVSDPAFYFLRDGARRGATYCASAWVLIPTGAEIDDLGLALFGWPSLRYLKADLSVRDHWQRLFVIAQVVDGRTKIVPSMVARLRAGSCLYTAGWDFDIEV